MATNGSYTNGNSDIRLGMKEVRPFRPFKSSEEYLYAMKEDLAEWLKGLYELDINADNFCEILETGIVLCRHANYVRRKALEFIGSDSRRLPYPIPAKEVTYRENVSPATFQARDNVSNFISWCRALHIIECLLFETDDLVLRKNEKSFILCLLEVARRGSKVGMPAPLLVQMEEEIDREIARDNAKRMRDSGVETDPMELEIDLEPPRQIITNDLKSLDEMVRDLVNRCNCQVQFPIIRISEGKYRIGDTKTLIFVRILRSHVMVRVGGGWDTLAHYLDKHDPCRCRQGHRAPLSSQLTFQYPSTPEINYKNCTNMKVTYLRSPVPPLLSAGNGLLTSDQPSPPSRNRSISPIHYYHQGSPPRQRRVSSSSASSSSHELSNESSIIGEPNIINITVGSDDSAYSSIRASPPQEEPELSVSTIPPSNGTHSHSNGVSEFANGVHHTSTPTDDVPSLSPSSSEANGHKSRIPTNPYASLTRKKLSPTKNGHTNIDNNNINRTNANNKRVSAASETPRTLPRSRSQTDDVIGLSSNFSRGQQGRYSCRLPRSPSAPWTPTANNTVNGHNDKNRTWSGCRSTKSRPTINQDLYDKSKNDSSIDHGYNNNNHHKSNYYNNGSTNNYTRSQTNIVQNSPVKHCPNLLRELLCDRNLDTDEKVLEKMANILKTRKTDKELIMAVPNNVILVEVNDGDDYTKKWLTDVDKFSKTSSASNSQGIASPDYGSDFGCETGHLEQQLSTAIKNKKSTPVVSPRKNNHPNTETKIPKPIFWS